MSVSFPRKRDEACKWGNQLGELATVIDMLGQALVDGDEATGPIVAGAVAANLARLPQHIRDAFTEALSDEAARSARADDLYLETVTR